MMNTRGSSRGHQITTIHPAQNQLNRTVPQYVHALKCLGLTASSKPAAAKPEPSNPFAVLEARGLALQS
jgi:hypothetical protein